MANQYFKQVLQTKIPALGFIHGGFTVGASGAVTATNLKSGVQAITKLATGIYKIQVTDNYVGLITSFRNISSPTTGAPVAAGSLTPGTLYQITTLGTTTTAQWVTAGVPANEVPAVGLAFVAAATSGGTGTATAVGSSGVVVTEVASGPNLTQITSNGISATGKGFNSLIFQCMNATGGLVQPASGSGIGISLLVYNSTAAY